MNIPIQSYMNAVYKNRIILYVYSWNLHVTFSSFCLIQWARLVSVVVTRKCPARNRPLHVSYFVFSSVQFSHSAVSDSLRPHESQHARPPCPSPTPGVYSNSCPSSWWCHPAISSSVVPFSSCPQSLPASGFVFICWWTFPLQDKIFDQYFQFISSSFFFFY